MVQSAFKEYADALSHARQVAEMALTDPSQHARALRSLQMSLGQLENSARGFGRMPRMPIDVVPNRFFVVEPAAFTAATGVSAVQTLRFARRGIVLAMSGSCLEAGLAGGLSLRMQREGKDDLILSNGGGAAFANFQTLFSASGLNWAPVGIEVNENETWNIFFRNETAAVRTPVFTLSFHEFDA